MNASRFVAESTAGLLAHSTAQLADSLDMLGDASVYGLSVYGLYRGVGWRAGAALTKGIVMAVFGIGVVLEAALKLAAGVLPAGSLMGMVGMLALAANVSCFVLLMRHRRDDLNMRSTWACSRNAVIANSGVLLAAAGVASTGTVWPDILIGLLIASLFLIFRLGRYSGLSARMPHERFHGDLTPRGTSSSGRVFARRGGLLRKD